MVVVLLILIARRRISTHVAEPDLRPASGGFDQIMMTHRSNGGQLTIYKRGQVEMILGLEISKLAFLLEAWQIFLQHPCQFAL